MSVPQEPQGGAGPATGLRPAPYWSTVLPDHIKERAHAGPGICVGDSRGREPGMGQCSACGLVEGRDFTAIDSEGAAARVRRIASVLRMGKGKGWTMVTALSSLTYPYFECLVWQHFEHDLRAGRFDLVHRVTPLSPTAASPIALRCTAIGVPFLVGPRRPKLARLRTSARGCSDSAPTGRIRSGRFERHRRGGGPDLRQRGCGSMMRLSVWRGSCRQSPAEIGMSERETRWCTVPRSSSRLSITGPRI
jgi:hypothetical protein